MLRGQLQSSNIALNTSRELPSSLLCYLWPPLTFGISADCWNSVLWNPRTSICKGKAHMLKPTSSKPSALSCLVPRLAYAPPLLLISSEFIGGTVSDTVQRYVFNLGSSTPQLVHSTVCIHGHCWCWCFSINRHAQASRFRWIQVNSNIPFFVFSHLCVICNTDHHSFSVTLHSGHTM